MNNKVKESYAGRDAAIRSLGFNSYQHYLASQTWKGIRSVLIDGRRCRLCRKYPATQLHHQRYEEEDLRGDNLEFIVPVCGGCHKRVEYTSCDNKRTFEEAVATCNKLIKRAPKHDTKTRPKPRPNKKKHRPKITRKVCAVCGFPVRRSKRAWCRQCAKNNPNNPDRKKPAQVKYVPSKSAILRIVARATRT